jgi:hypothetical protein
VTVSRALSPDMKEHAAGACGVANPRPLIPATNM